MNEVTNEVVASEVGTALVVASEVVEVKRGRGRPAVYTGAVLVYILSLIGTMGLTKTRKLLNAQGAVLNSLERKFGVKRDRFLVPKALGISMVTLCHAGQKACIQLKRGRPVKSN